MKTFNKALLASTLMVASTASFAATDLLLDPIVATSVTTGTFSSTYEFDLSSAADVTVTLSNNTTGTFFDIDSLSFFLKDGTAVTTFGSFSLGSEDIFSATYTLAAGADYMATISGTSTGSVGGLYTFSAIASPVPEASTLSLMMAGFGLVGLMSYRRRNSI